MVIVNAPIKLTDAARLHAVKTILPTNLGNRELTALDEAFHRRAFVVSRVGNARYLEGALSELQSILEGKQSLTYARLSLQNLNDELNGEGIRPDLASQKSIDRMLETNLNSVRGLASLIEGNDPDQLDDYPCVELVRFEDRVTPRGSPEYKAGTPAAIGWDQRWVRAAQIAGDDAALRVFQSTGRMICRKDAEIRNVISDSGVFPDGLDNNYGTPAWGSGMDWIEVSRSDAIAAGAIAATDKVEPADPSGFNENLEMTPGLANSDILDELLKSLGDVVTLKNGVLGFS